jgi:hypothetical protein
LRASRSPLSVHAGGAHEIAETRKAKIRTRRTEG